MATRRIVLVCIAGLLVLVLAPAALAGPSTAPSATVTASPNPVAAWSQYTLGGCGYVAGKQVNFVINGGMFFAAGVDDNGCIIPFTQGSDAAGTYTIKTYQHLKGRKQTLMATTTLTVY
jgi:hypothetical protein